MKKTLLTLALAALSLGTYAQRVTDKLDRGLVAQKVTGGVFLTWRIYGEEYYDVKYNVYRDGVKVNEEPLDVSNFKDTGGTVNSEYTVSAVVRGKEQAPSKAVKPWASSYKEINPKHDKSLKSTYVPNDACCADVDGDGELEILLKYDNADEIGQSYPKYGPKIDGKDTREHTLLECLKMDGTVLWWVNCGPNMGDFQNNEINIVGYDWDGDGKAEVVIRAADGTTIHQADGTVYTVGNASLNYRGATGGGTNWFMHDGAEFLVYMNGETGKPYQCVTYPLARLESGETDLNKAWGDGYGHRSSKYFFGAPYLDGRHPSIFLARGIYTRHKMIAYDVDPATHALKERWRWYNNTGGPWKGQGYHNYGIADVDLDGRDEIVFGSMVIDDNGKGLSTTGLGHGDAQHCGDFNPYVHGLEIYACNEDQPGNNYRDATTSKLYHRNAASKDDGRSMCGNFTDAFPGALGCSASEGAISTVTGSAVAGLEATGVNTNFRIYWDGDLCEETFNYVNGKNTAGCIAKYGSWSPIYTCEGSMTNNDTKGTPCYQGDILGDWREEIIMRTANNRIRIYSTPTPTAYRNYTLWHDHQYRNAMVWQMCGYNQPPHVSYFLGKLEGITMAPPPLTMTDREEVPNGGTIGASYNDKHVIFSQNAKTTLKIEDGAKPYILTINVPTWVQGTAPSECSTKDTKINYATYECTVSGGGLAGEARLVKQGDGILNLPKADFTHSGETNIWAGVLNFDGTMKNSPLWLNRFAELNSNGGEFKSIKADYAAVIRPGGADAKGSISVAESLDLGFGSRLVMDIYGSDLSADKVSTKVLSIERKTGNAWTKGGPEFLQPVLEINGHDLVAGDYILGDVEEIDGSLANLKVVGVTEFPTSLKHEDGKLILTLGGVRGATNTVWTAAENSTWDFASSLNFAVADDPEATPDMFVNGDVVTFDDNAKSGSVTLVGSLTPGAIIVANDTKAYTFAGTGSIADGSLTKEGAGTLTISTVNTYTGGTFLKGGTVKVSKLANTISPSGNLGGIVSSNTKFTMENGAVLQTTDVVTNSSPIKLIGEQGGEINAAKEFTQEKALTGTLLVKTGAGNLTTKTANGNLTRIVVKAGSIAAQGGNPAATVEMQGGTLWDDTQATTHGIYIPKGKSATWQLTNTYYTAYSNKLTGEGTLTIVPRNTVSRVRIVGDWSQFEGTVKHTNKNIWLPLDATGGIPKGTLDVAAGCTVTNVAKTFRIGKLTGGGDLAHPIANFQNSSPVSGNNTWQVGNSLESLGDFTFAGRIHDDGGNKSNFEKVGSCKMTVSGLWDNSGYTKITEGTLHLSSGGLIGKGALTLAKEATLSGTTKTDAPLTNSTYTLNGTVMPGASATAATGELNFGGKDVTFGATSTLSVILRTPSAGEGKASGTSITKIKKLTFNGTIEARLYANYAPAAGDVLRIWTSVESFDGTPKFSLPETHVGKDGSIYTITWDTSRIAEGVVVVASVEVETNIENIIAADETVKVEVVSLSGAPVCSFYTQMSEVSDAFRRTATEKGIYILNILNENGRRAALKVRK